MGWVITIAVLFAIIIIVAINGQEKIALMTPDEKQKYLEEKKCRLAEANQRNQEIQYGSINAAMMCPHCQTDGKIRTKHIMQKKGVSGGKATAAVLTGGLSLLAVGLSRKEGTTQAHCDNCNNTWLF
jgi:hypothetical protein